MRPSLDHRTVCGTLALAATLLLSSPGVQVVRADDGAPLSSSHATPLPNDGPTCSAGAPDDAAPAQLAAMMERARLEALAAAESQTAEEAEAHGVVLNNRGYNYGPAPTPNPALLDAERRGY